MIGPAIQPRKKNGGLNPDHLETNELRAVGGPQFAEPDGGLASGRRAASIESNLLNNRPPDFRLGKVMEKRPG
tara:strand:- start:7114 stop:7332 length:219 start_codon:yes stop_codon:yes gene_type:complete